MHKIFLLPYTRHILKISLIFYGLPCISVLFECTIELSISPYEMYHDKWCQVFLKDIAVSILSLSLLSIQCRPSKLSYLDVSFCSITHQFHNWMNRTLYRRLFWRHFTLNHPELQLFLTWTSEAGWLMRISKMTESYQYLFGK